MAARRARLDDDAIEPFARGIDGGREPGLPGADDRHRPHLGRVDRRVEAEAKGDPAVRRVLEDHLAAAHEHGNVGDVDVKDVEERQEVRLGIGVDVRVRMAIAREELLHAQRAGGVLRADQHDVARVRRQQAHAAQDERAQHDLGQLGVGLHQRAQARPLDHDHARRAACAAADERTPARDHVDLAGERARRVHGDRMLGGRKRADARRMRDDDLAGEDDHHRAVGLALIVDDLAIGERLLVTAKRPHAR